MLAFRKTITLVGFGLLLAGCGDSDEGASKDALAQTNDDDASDDAADDVRDDEVDDDAGDDDADDDTGRGGADQSDDDDPDPGVGGSEAGGSEAGGSEAGASGGTGGQSTGGAGGQSMGEGGASGGTKLDPEWIACADNNECVLTQAVCGEACCGYQSAADAVAVNLGSLSEAHAMICDGEEDICALVDCADTGPRYVLPLCRAGSCAAVDIREDSLTECAAAGDCMLRYGTGACEGCGDESTIVAVPHDFVSNTWGDEPAVCLACEPPPIPDGYSAGCQAGHCVVFMR